MFNTFDHMNFFLQSLYLIPQVAKVAHCSAAQVILVLGRSLPHLVPHVGVKHREEWIPLILCTATLHPEPKERDELLSILFNLIVRPNPDQRWVC